MYWANVPHALGQIIYNVHQSITVTTCRYCALTACMNGLQAEVDRLQHLIDAHANRADYILDAAEENIDSFEATLQQQERRQEHRKRAALQSQRQALARAAAQEMVNERRQRMASLRQVEAPCLPQISHAFLYQQSASSGEFCVWGFGCAGLVCKSAVYQCLLTAPQGIAQSITCPANYLSTPLSSPGRKCAVTYTVAYTSLATCLQIRAKLQLLEQSFQFKGNEQEISHTAHRLSVGAFALQNALDKVHRLWQHSI